MYPPAWSVVEPAISSGANGNGEDGHARTTGPAVIWKLLVGNASGTNGLAHGVKSDVVHIPAAVGVDSAACAPPLKESLKS